MGDYPFYSAVDSDLKKAVQAHPGTVIAAYGEMVLATVAVSSIAPNMAPDWLKTGDFGAFPVPLKPYTLYLRAKYLQQAAGFQP